MKIAFFSDTHLPQVNGVTRTIERLKSAMDQAGIEYRFFVPTEGDEKRSSVIPHFHLPLFLYPECKIAFPQYSVIKQQLDDFEPDLIHVITPFPLGYMGYKYAKERGIPLVSSYHTNFVEYLRYYHLDALEPFYWKYFRWFHSQCALNLCPSKDTLRKLENQGIKNLKIWDRGIDPAQFSPSFRSDAFRKTNAPNDEILLLYVGRISIEKEIECLMEASKVLNVKNVKHKLIIVGDGPHLPVLIRKNYPNILFLGYKKGKELQEIYASSDLFLFASPTETYGNVILEAMASGLPVIAVNEGGITENLYSNYNGFAVARGDSKEMAHQVEHLVNSPEDYNRIRENALGYSKGKSWDQVFRNLFLNYKEVVISSQQLQLTSDQSQSGLHQNQSNSRQSRRIYSKVS